MILFVVEGIKTEPKILKMLGSLFFEEQPIVASYGTNIYSLYSQLQADPDKDLFRVLQAQMHTHNDTTLDSYRSDDFSEIYLFFDYDFHNSWHRLEEQNQHIEAMLNMFNNETDKGKLYINYPMVEAIRYTKRMPDRNYHKYWIRRADAHNFKSLTHEFSFYNSYSFLRDKETWEKMKYQNLCKANYLCEGKLTLPEKKRNISQKRIFKAQLEHYVHKRNGVSILSCFPLFIWDYFR